MINIAGRKDYLRSLESIAMTDIVLNMFIFFFISFSLLYTFSQNRISKIEVRLPKASSAISLEGREKTILVITRSGQFFIDDEKVNSGSLKKTLQEKLRARPSMSLLLRVDAFTKFDNVVKALDVVNELKIQQVSVAAMKEKGDR